MSSGSGPSKRGLEPSGGYKQRLERSRGQSSNAQRESELGKLLVSEWAWGAMSAPQIQRFAAAALSDGSPHNDIAVLASLGSCGRYPANCHSELVSKLAPTYAATALSQFPLFTKKLPMGICKSPHTMLLPHELFATMFKNHPKFFLENICGGSFDIVRKFWSSMHANPMYQAHPMRGIHGHQDKFIPIWIHGDGVPVSGIGRSWGKSVDIWSWGSLLSSTSTLLSTFMIFFFFSALIVKMEGQDAFRAFMKILSWSLEALFTGRWPDRNVHGRPYDPNSAEGKRAGSWLADGYRAVVWSIKGDLDHMSKAFDFPYWNQSEPCGLCGANQTTKPWTDARPNAAWESTVWTNSSHAQAFPQRNLLFQLPGGGIETFAPDIMHTMHLGTYRYFFGSVLKYLTHHVLPGPQRENLATVWAKIREGYRVRVVPSSSQTDWGVTTLRFLDSSRRFGT